MKHISKNGFRILNLVTAAAMIGLLSITNPVEAKGKDTTQPLGGSIACVGFYQVDQTDNSSNWKFSNFNNEDIRIDRIRVYQSDGVLYSDNRWNEDESRFIDAELHTIYFPEDGNGNITETDNVLEAYQSFIYHSNTLLPAGMLPQTVESDGNISLIVDWSAENPVYPLVGGLIRHRSTPEGGLGRSTSGCHLIQSY